METTYNWLKQYVDTDLSPEELCERLTMSGLEVEELVKVDGQDDWAIKIEVTSNRVDAYGALGVARDLAALVNEPVSLPDADYKTDRQRPAADVSSVTIEDEDLCPYYSAQIITDLKVEPSSGWLRERIEALGAIKSIRPVNNVVDITNFVLLETGQPLHAFDLDKLDEQRVVIRRARAGETIRAIDDVEYTLDARMCVIADATQPQGIGGVMGGKDSEITAATTSILLESAYFAPMNNRATARKLGLYSDSSFRFSRGVNPPGVMQAQRRAARLLAELCGGTVLDGIIEAGELDIPEYASRLRLERVEAVLGFAVEPKRCIEILERLGCKVKAKPGVLDVKAPAYRRDLTREADLIEEIGRIEGFAKAPTKTALVARAAPPSHRERVEARLRDVLTGAGFSETVSDTFVPDGVEAYSVSPWCPRDALRNAQRATNPVRQGQGLLRPSVMPSLLVTKKFNQDRGEPEVALYEMSRVFLPSEPGAAQSTGARASGKSARTRAKRVGATLGDGVSSGALPALAHRSVRGVTLPREPLVLSLLGPDLRELKGLIEVALGELAIDYVVEPHAFELFQPGSGIAFRSVEGGGARAPVSAHRSATPRPASSSRRAKSTRASAAASARRSKRSKAATAPTVALLAVCGAASRATLDAFELQTSAAIGECNLSELLERATFQRTLVPLPRFPGIDRELAVILGLDVPWANVERTVRTACARAKVDGHDLLADIRFLADYRGKPIPKSAKQYTLACRFQHPDRTLTASEANDVMAGVIAALASSLEGRVRGGAGVQVRAGATPP